MSDQLPTAPPLTPDDATRAEGAQVAAPQIYTDNVPASAPDAASRARQEAAHAIPFLWEGQELFPFTPHREDWWNILREHQGLPNWDDLVERGITGNTRLLRLDAVLVLWLCSHDLPGAFKITATLARDRAVVVGDYRRDKDRWLEVINQWGDEHADNDATDSAINLVLDILRRRHKTRAVPRATGSGRVGE